MKSDLNQDKGLQRVIPGRGSFLSTLTASLCTAGEWDQLMTVSRREEKTSRVEDTTVRRNPTDKTGANGRSCAAKPTNEESAVRAQWAWLERSPSGIICRF